MPQEECARALMFRGADKSLKNKSDEDAYQVAIASGNMELANTIQNFRPDEVGRLWLSHYMYHS